MVKGASNDPVLINRKPARQPKIALPTALPVLVDKLDAPPTSATIIESRIIQ